MVADKAQDEQLQISIQKREGNNSAKAVPDILIVGQQRVKASTVAKFNKKIDGMRKGFEYEDDELDTLGPTDFTPPSSTDNAE